MKSIRRDELKRYSFPGGAHVLELVSALEPCQVREHFTGQECLHLEDLRDFAHRCPKDEPVIVHCAGRVDCHLAGQMLEYAGFDNVYVYEGELKDLRHLGWQERPTEVAVTRAAAVRAWGGAAKHLEPGGYAESFGGVAEDRLRDEESLSWSAAVEQIEPFWVELSEEEYARSLARRERPAEADIAAWGGAAEHLEERGYAEPFGGAAEERLRDEESLSWSAAVEQIEPFWVELSEEEYARRLARAEEEEEMRMPPPEAEPGFEHLPPWAY